MHSWISFAAFAFIVLLGLNGYSVDAIFPSSANIPGQLTQNCQGLNFDSEICDPATNVVVFLDQTGKLMRALWNEKYADPMNGVQWTLGAGGISCWGAIPIPDGDIPADYVDGFGMRTDVAPYFNNAQQPFTATMTRLGSTAAASPANQMCTGGAGDTSGVRPLFQLLMNSVQNANAAQLNDFWFDVYDSVDSIPGADAAGKKDSALALSKDLQWISGDSMFTMAFLYKTAQEANGLGNPTKDDTNDAETMAITLKLEKLAVSTSTPAPGATTLSAGGAGPSTAAGGATQAAPPSPGVTGGLFSTSSTTSDGMPALTMVGGVVVAAGVLTAVLNSAAFVF